MKDKNTAIAMAKLRVDNLKKRMIDRAKKGKYKEDIDALAKEIKKAWKGNNNGIK